MGNQDLMTLSYLLSMYNPRKVYLLACATNGLAKNSKLLALGLYEVYPNEHMQIMYINRPDSEVQENNEYHKISTDLIHTLGEDLSIVASKFEELSKDSILLTFNAGFQHQFLEQLTDTPETLSLYDWTIIEKATRNNVVLNNEDIATFADFMRVLEHKFDPVPLTRYTGKDSVIAPGQTTLEQRLEVSFSKFSEVLSREFEVR